MDQSETQPTQPQTPAVSNNTPGSTPAPTPNKKPNFYPILTVKNNEHPSKLLAFPFFGMLIKLILLIPVYIYFLLLSIMFFFYWIILPFVILFSGKYWAAAYKFITGYMKYNAKISYYVYGITDKYPGFTMSEDGIFTLAMEQPVKPSRGLAFPFFGYLVRIILMIPYSIYNNILQSGASVALFASWFVVLFKGKYPESLYEFNRDTIRVSLAMTAYITYMSDIYPSFWISMNHKNVKIALIVLGIIFGSINTAIDIATRMGEMQQRSANEYPLPSTENESF